MTNDDGLTWPFIHGVLDVRERHGYRRPGHDRAPEPELEAEP
jgi:hypothetical protein